MAGKIFINYRRADEPGYVHALNLQLRPKLGPDNVFFDVAEIYPGDDFAEELNRRVADCDVLLAVIGPKWEKLLGQRAGGFIKYAIDLLLGVGLPTRRSRVDYVALEIEAAFNLRKGVIPVLVAEAIMPTRGKLPASIRELANLQFAKLRHDHFDGDCFKLMVAIERQLAVAARERMRRTERSDVNATAAALFGRFDWRKHRLVLGGLALSVLLVGGLVYSIADKIPEPPLPMAPPPAAKLLTLADERALKPLESFRECDACPEMVVLPAGSFLRGSPDNEAGRRPDEGPRSLVTIPRPFAVGKFEVTCAQWDACVAEHYCKAESDKAESDEAKADRGWGRGNRPVINVKWSEVTKQYLPWLSRKTGYTYRLLTEAEWEYAARAGSDAPYAFGGEITLEQAWFAMRPDLRLPKNRKTLEVGALKPNAFKLHDMHGNAWEWVQDCYRDSYDDAPVDGSSVEFEECPHRVLRGGAWDVWPEFVRSALRVPELPEYGYGALGFRVARTLAAP
jgi:formylglycine-generating enzyme required for sulfatase activity